MLPSKLDAIATLSVHMNGLLIPATEAVRSVARFCRPLLFYNTNNPLELSLQGSGFMCRLKGKNLFLASRHQLGSGDAARKPDEAVVLIPSTGGHLALTAAEAMFVTLHGGPVDEPLDLLMLRYEDRRGGQDIRNRFLNVLIDDVLEQSELPAGSKVLAHVAIGYATQNQGYDVSFEEETFTLGLAAVRSRWSHIYLEPDALTSFDDPALSPYKLIGSYTIQNFDGFSGAPVFLLYQDPADQAHMAFVGLVLKANQAGRFNILGGRKMKAALRDLPA